MLGRRLRGFEYGLREVVPILTALLDILLLIVGIQIFFRIVEVALPGKPGEPDHSWGGLMKADFMTIVTNLGGDASAVKAVNTDIGLKDKAYYPQ